VKSIPIWKAGVVLLCVIGVFLAACGPTPAAAASGNPQPCISTTPGANGYRNVILDQVRDVYSSRFTDVNVAKNDAFSLLVNQVQRWSSTVDVPVDNGNFIRITLTYISPELAQIIILNHQLHKNNPEVFSFEQVLQDKMNEVADREEMLFLMTVTYSDYDPPSTQEINRVRLSIPMDELALVNSRNTRIPAHNVDPPLRQEIITSRGPSAGYIAFPIGVRSGENCVEAFEHRFNTIINVQIGKVNVNGTDYAHPLAWSVKYHSLVDLENGEISSPAPYSAPQTIPINHRPPDPVRGTPVELTNGDYWQTMALHVWGYVTDP